MGFDPGFMLEAVPRLVGFLPVTLLLAVGAMALGVALGLVLALVRFADVPVAAPLARLFVSFFRGIPSLVLLFLVYFGLPSVVPAMSAMTAVTAAVLGLGFKQAAYLAEIFRAALLSVDRGQYEAGLAVGMSPPQIYRRFIIPQAAFNALPGTGNVFVSLLKETSVAFTLGLTEIFAEAKLQASASFRFFETFLVVGLVYWAMVIVYTWFQGRAERVMARPYVR